MRRVGRNVVVMVLLCAMLVATVSVAFAAAKITKQPDNKTVLVGDTVSFTVVATGSGTLKYQWQSLAPGAATWKNSLASSAKTATLSFTAQEAHNGYKFRCQVTDSSGKPTTSVAAVLTVKAKITTQPKNTSVTLGSIAKFTVVAIGKAPLKYQWQAYNPNTKKWVDSMSDSAKTATLKFTAQTGHNGFKFRCIVTDGNGNKTTSSEATLKALPKITTQPKDVSVKEGGTAVFTIAATGKAAISYQWQSKAPTSDTWKNSISASAKTANFTFTAALAHQGYMFRCIVKDSTGNQSISKEVKLTLCDIPVNAKYFPDAKFRMYITNYVDTDHSNKLSAAEIKAVSNINVNGFGIKSLKGVEFFTELIRLECSYYLDDGENYFGNAIPSIDLSRNTKLQALYCDDIGLTSLDVSRMADLVTLDCGWNQLASIDLSKNTKLEYLYCESNKLKSLNVSKNTLLHDLYFGQNDINSINLQNNPLLVNLSCLETGLASLDVSSHKKLRWLDCGGNPYLSTLKLPAVAPLEGLNISGCTGLTSVDLTKYTALENLYCTESGLTSLNVSKNTALVYLYCEGNGFTSLNLSNNPKLTTLHAYGNKLTKIDFTNNPLIRYIILDSGVTVTGKPADVSIEYR